MSRLFADTFYWIAVTAQEHNLSLEMRNVRNFDDLGLGIINPWET